jgi:hypothetical protein
MAKLRRTDRNSYQFPVAADVLEARSMLSAGVHAALAHAHHDLHALAAPKPVTVNFAGPFVATVNIAELGVSNLQFSGNFSKASVTLAVGKSYSVNFNQTVSFEQGGLTINSISGKLTGKVSSINSHVIQITPAGKITVGATFEGLKLSVSIVPKPGVNSVLTLNPSNQFVSLTGTFKLPTKGPLHGGDVDFSLVP